MKQTLQQKEQEITAGTGYLSRLASGTDAVLVTDASDHSYKIFEIESKRRQFKEHSDPTRYHIKLTSDGKMTVHSGIQGFARGMYGPAIRFNKAARALRATVKWMADDGALTAEQAKAARKAVRKPSRLVPAA